MNFPGFSRCLGCFFFFQEFGCGPGGCHPFIFECTMPSRRKGMKGVGIYPPRKDSHQFNCQFHCQENIEGRTFKQYLTYHFNYWMASGPWGMGTQWYTGLVA